MSTQAANHMIAEGRLAAAAGVPGPTPDPALRAGRSSSAAIARLERHASPEPSVVALEARLEARLERLERRVGILAHGMNRHVGASYLRRRAGGALEPALRGLVARLRDLEAAEMAIGRPGEPHAAAGIAEDLEAVLVQMRVAAS